MPLLGGGNDVEGGIGYLILLSSSKPVECIIVMLSVIPVGGVVDVLPPCYSWMPQS